MNITDTTLSDITLNDITIAIVTYNSAHIIADAIKHLPKACPVIFVDNASHDNSAQIVREHCPHATLIINDKNLGFGAGMNVAIKACKTRFILMLNPDAVIDDINLHHLRQSLINHNTAVMSVPYINGQNKHKITPYPLLSDHHPLFKPMKLWRLLSQLFWGRDYKNTKTIDNTTVAHEIGKASGAIMLYDLSKMPTPLLFDENIFLFFEETELMYRLICEYGYKMLYVPYASADHAIGQSSQFSDPLASLAMRDYYGNQSRGYLCNKYRHKVSIFDEKKAMLRLYLLALIYKLTYNKDKYYRTIQRIKGYHSGKKIQYHGGDA